MIKELNMKNTIILTVLSMLFAFDIAARQIDYSAYSFTEIAELIVQCEVMECRSDRSYKVRVTRVIKGVSPQKVIELPSRYFYYARTGGWEGVSLAQHSKAVLFLRYVKNGDHDGFYKLIMTQLVGGDTAENREKVPYHEGYELVGGSKGALVRETKKELDAIGDSIILIDAFQKGKSVKHLNALFLSDKTPRLEAMSALIENSELFIENRELFGKYLIDDLSKTGICNRAAALIGQLNYQEATEVLQSHTNSPNIYFRGAVNRALKALKNNFPSKSQLIIKDAENLKNMP